MFDLVVICLFVFFAISINCTTLTKFPPQKKKAAAKLSIFGCNDHKTALCSMAFIDSCIKSQGSKLTCILWCIILGLKRCTFESYERNVKQKERESFQTDNTVLTKQTGYMTITWPLANIRTVLVHNRPYSQIHLRVVYSHLWVSVFLWITKINVPRSPLHVWECPVPCVQHQPVLQKCVCFMPLCAS